MLLKEIFGQDRIAALAGNQSTGKTNNIAGLIKDFREHNKTTPIYVFGMNEQTIIWLQSLGNVFEVSSLEQLSDKRNSLIIVDELQRLLLNDRRHKVLLDKFIDFIYHNNNWLLLSSPNLREFNSIIGGKIERWLLKSVRESSLVNGSQLKEVVAKYNGRFKAIEDLNVPQNSILIINREFEKIVEIDYIKEIDNKISNVSIF